MKIVLAADPRIEEHEAILAALRARDASLAQARLAAHLERFRGLVLKHLSIESTEAPADQVARAEGVS